MQLNCHVLRKEDGRILRRPLQFEVDRKRNEGRSKRTWRKQLKEEYVKVELSRDVLY